MIKHPAFLLQQLIEPWQHLGVSTETTQCALWIETPRGHIRVYCVRLLSKNPEILLPNTDWIELPESFGRPALEREMMRVLYDFLLGH